MPYIPLNVHSQYSILDSTISVEEIAKKSKEYGITACALTDSGNLFGIIEFYKACQSEKVKPILGCELKLAPFSRLEKKRIPGLAIASPLVLLAMNYKGYQNLCKLSSIAYLEGFYYYPRVDKEVLERYNEGLICLSGSIYSQIGCMALRSKEDLKKETEWYLSVFKDRFYFQLQRHALAEKDRHDQESWIMQRHEEVKKKETQVIQTLYEVSKEIGISCVAANEIHYLEKEDWKAHEILLNIQSGEPCEIVQRDSQGKAQVRTPNPKRKIYDSHEHYFKSAQEMEALFSDIPEAVSNTLEIADRCKCQLDFQSKHYPVFFPPEFKREGTDKKEQEKAVQIYLRTLCEEGIIKRYTEENLKKIGDQYAGKDPLKVVRDRMEYELSIIIPKGMGDYILIVYDFINWAKQNNIPVGPGRGSAAGSIVAYLIGITDIEPLRFSLFFERFINPERISYPDIDVDICMDRRPDVIDYTINKYGKDRVAQIITFGKMKAKMAIKDVGRVLSVSLSKVNKIAKLVPEDPGMTLEKALEIDADLRELYQTDAESKMVIDMAKRAEGGIRNTSIHAAGMIISEDPITDHVPVCTAKDSDIVVTQFAMKPVEAVGMLKIDFLGLKTLTSIQKSVDALKKRKIYLDWCNLPLEDKTTFDLLNQGKTLGVFQLESGGMQELAKQLHIDRFEEIIAVGALYRPGPMDMIPSFIARKHGREPIEFDHPLMKDILLETYGVMVYQEQVMQIAQKLAGYALGEGDVLRRAMGKKDKEEMHNQRQKFLTGAKKQGLEEVVAVEIFNKIEKFASYGFNKSHATAYAYLSYVTAYLKANYPKEWMAALMTCDRDDLTKVSKFIHECHSLHIKILPPNINESGTEFIATEEGICFAMLGIKGMGEACVIAIVEEREKTGPFTSLYDFIKRIDKRKVTKKNIENLIEAGCFDFTGWSKDSMRQSLDAMYEKALMEQKEKEQGVMNLFSLMQNHQDTQFLVPPIVLVPSTPLQLLQKEKELLGLYLTGHPMDSYLEQVKKLGCLSLKEISSTFERNIFRFAFIVEDVVVKISSRSQKKFAILSIGEGLERFELPIWPELYEEKAHLLEENRLLYGIIEVDKRETLRMQCHYLEDLTEFDDSKIQLFNNAFEKASSHIEKGKVYKKKTEKMKNTEEKILLLSVDAEKVCLSQILQLKAILRKNSGDSPIHLTFVEKNKMIAKLKIDLKWKVKCDLDLRAQLEQIPSILQIETASP